MKMPYHDGKDHVFADVDDVVKMIHFIHAISPNNVTFRDELIRQLENLKE